MFIASPPFSPIRSANKTNIYQYGEDVSLPKLSLMENIHRSSSCSRVSSNCCKIRSFSERTKCPSFTQCEQQFRIFHLRNIIFVILELATKSRLSRTARRPYSMRLQILFSFLSAAAALTADIQHRNRENHKLKYRK